MAATERQARAEGGHLIKRPRLTRILDESNARIILLVAPAGYGKTTLAREWLEGKRHVWYRASSADADVAALAVGIASAAAELVPGVDRRIRQRVRAARDPEREASVLAELVAEDIGELRDDAWIAIDDYQFIAQTSAADQFLAELLDATSWRFLATSRVRPSWARARRVIYGGAVVLGRDELEMTDDEVGKTVGRTRAEVPTLFENAMGWPAIVGLAARVGPARLEGHALPADLHDFFAEELWQFLDEETRWKLAQVALAAPCPKAVAETLLGEQATDVLETTTRSGWLTRDPNEVVIHPLLARFLRQRFETYPAQNRTDAVHRLLRVLTEQGEWDRAMALALDADKSTVPHIFVQSLELLLSTGRLPTIERWLDLAGKQDITAPVLCLAAAEVSFRRGEYHRAEVLARTAASEPGFPAFRARSLNLAGHSARRLDDLESALELYGKARDLAADDSSLREAVIGEILTSLELGSGERETLLARLPADDGSGVNRLRRVTVEGQIAAWLGDIQAAITSSDALVSLVSEIDDPLARTAFLHTRAYLLAAAAHYRTTLETCTALEGEAREYRIDFALLEFWAPRATAEAGLRNFGLARRVIDEKLALAVRDGDRYTTAGAAAVAARIEVSANSRIIPPFRSGLEEQPCVGAYAEYVLSVALAEGAFGNPVRARALRVEALNHSQNSETEVLSAWVDAVLAPEDRELVSSAFALTLDRGY